MVGIVYPILKVAKTSIISQERSCENLRRTVAPTNCRTQVRSWESIPRCFRFELPFLHLNNNQI